MQQQTSTSVYPVVVTSIKEEVAGVKTLFVERADKAPIKYVAGQFLTFAFTLYHKEERRSYSISSSPNANEPVSVTLKRVDNGAYSRYLTDTVKRGDLLQTAGAGGLFTLPADIYLYQQFFFFAAGIGITPIYSLIKTLLYTGAPVSIVLIYSNTSDKHTVFHKELDVLAGKYPHFRVEYLFSSHFDLSRARLNKLLLPMLLQEYGTALKQETLYYICGPFSYMRMVTFSLEENGVPGSNIRKENFDVHLPLPKMQPPDTTPRKVHLHFNGHTHELINIYPDAILQTARKSGIHLPYSCEAGRCGSCAALCTEGKIWMANNEVLTDADISNGKILTCVGHPAYGDVSITA